MTDTWRRLEHQFQIHALELLASLRPGASNVELDALEMEIGQHLPRDIREAYLRHDGCDYRWDPNPVGLFGRFQWRPIAQVLDEWRWNCESFEPIDPYFYGEREWSDLPLRPWQRPPPQWLPIAETVGSACFIYVDLLPGPTGVVGQLVAEDVHGMSKWVISRSLDEFLLSLTEGLETKQVKADVIPATQLRHWVRGEGEPFKPPGFARVFG